MAMWEDFFNGFTEGLYDFQNTRERRKVEEKINELKTKLYSCDPSKEDFQKIAQALEYFEYRLKKF